jgi:hypothetical protein
MATIINADTSDGLKLTSDTSGQIDFQSAGSTKAQVSSTGLAVLNGADVSMSSAAAGQLKVDGSGYSFAVALDASAAHLYHNSAARDLVLGVNETEQMRLTPAGLLKFNSGFGSVGTAYGCRAWVNFNGVGTVAIRESGNVTSITDNGTGDYTVNFSTAMPDINYVTNSFAAFNNHVGGNGCLGFYTSSITTTSARGVVARSYNNTVIDATHLALSIVR